ncbi:thioredoxin-like protein AAED1, chloroplastic [Prosopis cineraria]|uniref:thioredoxin-like protein AAED1, chloroplastic n=1 Tax=Prosopis cineraria TaxID=364024 RepID=UPI0024108DFC|nr:thioredoxin-like protein AAED1, chloroplastic [Prosopis cineraria]
MVSTFSQNLVSPRPPARPLVPSGFFLPCFTTATPSFHAPTCFSNLRGPAVVGGKARLVARASASTLPYSPNIAEDLGDITIFTAGGEPVMFKDLWDQNEGLAVVALLRHFGCVCCWELASTLKEYKSRFDSVGVKLIAVGVGTPNKARILAERLPFPMDCLYADPERKAYNVLDLYYGVGRTFLNPASAKVFSRYDSFQKALKNYTIEATPDDTSGVLQQGGMLVFKGRQLLYARKDEGTGDHAPLDDIFEVCCNTPPA